MERLEESDIPGASLGGQRPSALTVQRLKRWLACRGASVAGRKAELVERVELYIEKGWSDDLVDPDSGSNVRRKLAEIKDDSARGAQNRPSVNWPSSDDSKNWQTSLSYLPAVTYPVIWTHLMVRKVLLEEVSIREDIADGRALRVEHGICDETDSAGRDGSTRESNSTRTLKKPIVFSVTVMFKEFAATLNQMNMKLCS